MGPSSSIAEHQEFLYFSCSHVLSKRKQSVVSKRAQESTAKEGSAVAKPRPMSLVSRNLLSARKTPPQDSSASNSPKNQELDQVRKLVRNNDQDPTAYSQERRQDDTPSSSTRQLVRSSESASSASTRKLVRGDDNQIERTRSAFHNMQVSDHRYPERVFRNLRQKLNLAEEAPVLDLKTNVLIWCLFTSTTMKAAVHLGPNYHENLEVYKNTNFEERKTSSIPLRDGYWNMKPKFRMYPRLIGLLLHGREQNTRLLRFRLMLREDARAFRSEQKGGMINLKNFDSPILTKNNLELIENRLSSGGEFFQDLLHWRSSRRPKKTCKIKNIEPENFEERIIFLSMFNDVEWTKRGNSERCFSNSEQVKNYAKRISRGDWAGDEENWYGTHNYKFEGRWDSIAREMVGRFKESCHRVFKNISALSRGILKKKMRQMYHAYTSMRIHRTQSSCFTQFSLELM